VESKRAREGRRLTCELLVLDTRTLVVDKPSDRVESSLRTMLEDLHENYRKVAGLGGDATFAELEAAARTRGAAGAVAEHKAARVLRYAGRLHELVDGAGAIPKGGRIELDERTLAPADASVINRAWEQALDRIDLRTTLQADCGNVVSRLGCEGRPPDVIIGFHRDMADLGIACWNELMALVLQIFATVTTLVRASGRRAARALWRLRMPKDVHAADAPAGRQRAKELFGRGGTLFVTGQDGAIRTLVQLDGDILTRATLDAMLDEDLLREHREKIAAWFARANRDWTRTRLALSTATLGATGWLLYRDVAAFPVVSAWDAIQVLTPLIPPALRGAFGFVARRWILQAIERPRLRPRAA
jgi:hypothetical protein